MWSKVISSLEFVVVISSFRAVCLICLSFSHIMDLIAPIVKYNSQTIGRDKLCRTLQYTAKLVGYLLQKHGATTDTVKLIKTLEVHISTSRKLFRIGKYLDMLQGAFRNLSVKDTALRLLVVSARITRVLYFLVDQIVWATRLGLYKSDPKAWSKFQAKIWSVALIFCITRNMYEIYNLIQNTDKKNEDPGAHTGCWYEKFKTRPEVFVDTVKNCADFLIPLNIIGVIEINNGIVGILGLISSLAGASTAWEPTLKLKP